MDCHQDRDSIKETLRGTGIWFGKSETTLEHLVGTESENNPKVATDETFRNFIVVRDAGSALARGTQRTTS